MADPFTWMAIGSTALSAGGAIMGGNAEYQQGMHESQIAQENARLARQNQAETRKAGAVAQEAKAREIRRSLGRSAAASSQSGTGGPSYGSNFSLLRQASIEGKMDELNTGYQYESEAYGYGVEALNQDSMAKAAKRRARGARKAGFLNAAAAVLGGASSYSGMKARRTAAQPRASSGSGRR